MEQKQKNIIAIVIIIAIIIITAGFVWQMFAKKLQPPTINNQIVAPAIQTSITQLANENSAINNDLKNYQNTKWGFQFSYPKLLDFSSVEEINGDVYNEFGATTINFYLPTKDPAWLKSKVISYPAFDVTILITKKTAELREACNDPKVNYPLVLPCPLETPVMENNGFVFFMDNFRQDSPSDAITSEQFQSIKKTFGIFQKNYEISDWKTYKNDKLDFEFKYPPIFEEEVYASSEDPFLVFYLHKGSSSYYMELDVTKSEFKNISEWQNYWQSRIREWQKDGSYPKSKISFSDFTNESGTIGKLADIEGVSFVTQDAGFIKGDLLYDFRWMTDDKETFSKILSTLKFTK